MKLYGSPNPKSVHTLKIRVALAEAGADHEFVPVDLAAGEHRTSDFVALNPHGKIPVLTDGAFALAESGAILWYVAERFPRAGLLGRELEAKAKVHEWCEFMSTGTYAAFSDISMHSGMLPPEKRAAIVVELAEQRLARGLDVLEHVLESRDYLADAYSIADIANVALVNALRDRAPHVLGAKARPRLEAWFARVASRPAWARALAR